MAEQNKARQELINRFLEALEQERLPWERGWVRQEAPRNPATGKRYRGVNCLTLGMMAQEKGYQDPRWCTYNQAKQQGWYVRKGETAAAWVEYWCCYDKVQKKIISWDEVKSLVKDNPSYDRNLSLRCRVSVVFNGEQIEGIPPYKKAPGIELGALRMYTLLHEAGHATGHESRLNRQLIGPYGSPDYAREELRAEIASAFVAQELGLPGGQSHAKNHTAYIQSWISVLRKDPNELFKAISDAQGIADYLIEKGQFLELEPALKEKGEVSMDQNFTEEQQEDPQSEAVSAPASQESSAEQTTPEPIYFPIDEAAARRASAANSFGDYIPGTATANYRQMVDQAAEIAQAQKKRVDPLYHEKIDRLLNTYARCLAKNMNEGFAIEARVPSILISGRGNFPVAAKAKQNAARDRNFQEGQKIQKLLDSIRSTGTAGITADDPQAISKLETKLKDLQEAQETMKGVNAYFRKNKTLDGCTLLPPELLEKVKSRMEEPGHPAESTPFHSFALSNNSAEIRRIQARIEDLKRQESQSYDGWTFAGGHIEANKAENRLQIFFDKKPDEATRTELKSNGFRWAPSKGAWQRQLNNNAYYAAKHLSCIQPEAVPQESVQDRQEEKMEVQEQPEERMVKTNMGTMPIADYRDIMAMQHGFDDAEDMYRHGYRLGKEYDPPEIAAQAEGEEHIFYNDFDNDPEPEW